MVGSENCSWDLGDFISVVFPKRRRLKTRRKRRKKGSKKDKKLYKKSKKKKSAQKYDLGYVFSFRLPSSFPERHLFLALYSRFGRPKGMMSISIGMKGDSAALWKWEYTLYNERRDFSISIQRNWAYIEVWCTSSACSQEEVERFLCMVARLAMRPSFRNEYILQRVHLVINPFSKFKSKCEQALRYLSQTKTPTQPEPPDLISNEELQEAYQLAFENYVQSSKDLSYHGSYLVLSSAAMIEALLNYFVIVANSYEYFKGSKKIKNILYKGWSEKVKKLHNYSPMFEKPIDVSDHRFGRVKELFRLRNRIAHSALDRDFYGVRDVYFLDNIPVLEKAETYPLLYNFVTHLVPSKVDCVKAYEDALEFVEYLLSYLGDERRRNLEFELEQEVLGIDAIDGHLVVAFRTRAEFAFLPMPDMEVDRV